MKYQLEKRTKSCVEYRNFIAKDDDDAREEAMKIAEGSEACRLLVLRIDEYGIPKEDEIVTGFQVLRRT